jgi:hypothetical protein
MVTMKIFIYYSDPGLLNSILAKFLNKTCPTFFCLRLYLYEIKTNWKFYGNLNVFSFLHHCHDNLDTFYIKHVNMNMYLKCSQRNMY